jgi:cGMP-dependent protein kinase
MLYLDLKITMDDVSVEGVLGKGQFGTVRHVSIEKANFHDDALIGFAMKSCSKKRVIELEQTASTKLEREILAECCHPMIVRLITTFQDQCCVHLVMETLSGGDLFTAIRDIHHCTEDHTLFYSASIVLGIEYIHSRGIIYRDLKPENIMLTREGNIKIVDFGSCSRKYRSYTFTGTPEYLAPEVILGKGYGQAVDWWSLGVIMYEMICGPLPFGQNATDPLGIMREVLEKELEFPPQVVGETSEDLLKELLEREPQQRRGSSTGHWQSEVRQHPFFEDLSWEALLEQAVPPPYVPPVQLHDPNVLCRSESQASMDSLGDAAAEEDWEKDLPDEGADLSFFEDF